MTTFSHVGFFLPSHILWSKIQLLFAPMHLKTLGKSNLLTRLFKIKFYELLVDLKKKII